MNRFPTEPNGKEQTAVWLHRKEPGDGIREGG